MKLPAKIQRLMELSAEQHAIPTEWVEAGQSRTARLARQCVWAAAQELYGLSGVELAMIFEVDRTTANDGLAKAKGSQAVQQLLEEARRATSGT